jgi:hypothetical protein
MQRLFPSTIYFKDYVERELSAAKKHLANGCSSFFHETFIYSCISAQNQPRRNSDPRDDALELSDELIKANMRMYELESQVSFESQSSDLIKVFPGCANVSRS